MERPIMIPHALKQTIHWSKGCFCMRKNTKQIYSIKVNTNGRLKFSNMVHLDTAFIQIGSNNTYYARLLEKQTEPIHVITFSTGANSFYWGRYKLGSIVDNKFLYLRFVDNGLQFDSPVINTRSNVERKWVAYFDSMGIQYFYEPCTFSINVFQKNIEYTPDFYIPSLKSFVEIKGHGIPTEEAREKIKKVQELGFDIKIVAGVPHDSQCYHH